MTHTQAARKVEKGEAPAFGHIVTCPLCRRSHVWRPYDQLLAVLNIYGPMTLAQLADHCGHNRRKVAAWLYHCRRRGFVRLVRHPWYRGPRGHLCGRWTVI